MTEGEIIRRAGALLRKQYVIMLSWAGVLVALCGTSWYGLYKLAVVLLDYTRARKAASALVVVSDDLFNPAADDEPADEKDESKARVPTGREIVRRLRRIEREGGGGGSEVVASLDPKQDDWPKPKEEWEK